MDKNKAYLLVEEFIPKISTKEIYKNTIRDRIGISCWHFVAWLYDNNYEIVDRSVSEKYVKESQKKTTR